MPEGFLAPLSTLISGPGGTGKPLVSFASVSTWLKQGGGVIGIPLQYPSLEFAKEAMAKLYKIDFRYYKDKVAWIQFDPEFNYLEKIADHALRANLLKPGAWDEAIKKAEQMIKKSDLGTMIFGSALNLFLFSPTYKNYMLGKMKEVLKEDKTRTYLFSVSTSAFAGKIKILEEAAVV